MFFALLSGVSSMVGLSDDMKPGALCDEEGKSLGREVLVIGGAERAWMEMPFATRLGRNKVMGEKGGLEKLLPSGISSVSGRCTYNGEL